MAAVNNGVDSQSAPADYADFFRDYYGYVIGLVRGVPGVKPQHVEDLAGEILLKFMEQDFLSEFQPDLIFLYKGQIRPARFKSFLTRFVILHARGLRDKNSRLANREQQVLDGTPLDSSTWLDEFILETGHEDRVIDAIDGLGLTAEIRAYLKTIPRRSAYDTCDLVALYDALVAEMDRSGTVTATALKDVFGVSNTAIYSWLRWLRVHVAAYLGQPQPRSRREPNAVPARAGGVGEREEEPAPGPAPQDTHPAPDSGVPDGCA